MQVSISGLSDLTGFDRRTIAKRLADLPCDDRGKGGKYYRSDHALSRLYTGQGDLLEPAQEKAMLDAARRRLADLEYAKRRGDLMQVENVFRALDVAATAFRNQLETIPGRFASTFAAETDARKIETELLREIHASLNHVIDAKEKLLATAPSAAMGVDDDDD